MKLLKVMTCLPISASVEGVWNWIFHAFPSFSALGFFLCVSMILWKAQGKDNDSFNLRGLEFKSCFLFSAEC